MVGALAALGAPNIKGSDIKKYKLFRRARSPLIGFPVTRAGPLHLMYAAERLEIRCHKPLAIVSSDKRSVSCNQVPRCRPPRSLRGYKKHQVREGTFEGSIASCQFAACVAASLRAASFNRGHQQSDMVRQLGLDFRHAYRHVQLELLEKTGQFDPLNMYCKCHWRLALLYLGSLGTAVDWGRLDKTLGLLLCGH